MTLNELHEQGKLIGRKVMREGWVQGRWVVFEYRLKNGNYVGVDNAGSPWIEYVDDNCWHLVKEPKARKFLWDVKIDNKGWHLRREWISEDVAKSHWGNNCRISAVCPEGIEDE